jgi:hypothetical protein
VAPVDGLPRSDSSGTLKPVMTVREIRPNEDIDPREALGADVVWFDWDLFSGRAEDIWDGVKFLSDQWAKTASQGRPMWELPPFWVLAESLPIASPKLEEDLGVVFVEKSQVRDEDGKLNLNKLVDKIGPHRVDILKEVPPSGTKWEVDHEGYLVRGQGNTRDQSSVEPPADMNPYKAALHFLDPDEPTRHRNRL